MPPVFGTLIAVKHALVVLRGRQRDRGLAVAQREERRLLAGEKFLHHDLGARFAQTAAEHHVDGGFGFVERLRHHHALAGREPIRLDDDRRALRAHIVLRRCRGGEALVSGSRNPVRLAQVLGEALGAFEPRGRLAWTERLDAGGARSSTIPAQSGASGPTTTKPMFRARQNATTAAWSARSSATSSHSCAMPALPGAQ